MSSMKFVFQHLNLSQATEHEYACLNEFKNSIHREYKPDDPPKPLDEHIQGWKNKPAFIEYEAYIIWNSSDRKSVV